MISTKRRRMTIRQLQELIGPQAAARLVEEWGGHDVPQLSEAARERKRRDEALRKYVDVTGSTSAAAQRFGISERHAKRIANSGE